MLDEIKKWFERCKRILVLAEHEIALVLDPSLEPLGTCSSDPTYGNALITLRDPRAGNHSDWKRSVLHELIHVRMGGGLGTEPGSEERSALERGVEMMTRILYRMISSGATDSAVSRAAQGCARTLTTAREGLKRGSMNAQRIIEIVSSLSAMAELPDEAKALIGELAALAVGGNEEPEMPAKEEPIIPEGEDKALAALPPTYRKQIADTMARIGDDLDVAERAGLVSRAEAELGSVLTPARRTRLLSIKRTDDPRRVYIEALKIAIPVAGAVNRTAPAREAPNVASERHSDSASSGVIVVHGEDPAKIPAHVLATRKALARLPGGAPMVAAAVGGKVVIQ